MSGTRAQVLARLADDLAARHADVVLDVADPPAPVVVARR